MEAINTLKTSSVQRCNDLLRENFAPYQVTTEEPPDEELKWCLVKNANLLNDPKFSRIYSLDKENRTALLEALTGRIALSQAGENKNAGATEDVALPHPATVSFLDVLKPLHTTPQETLEQMVITLRDANFDLPLFSQIPRLPNGKNPYGMNGAIAAMIDYFYQLNYFKKEYTLEEIFRAYSSFTGNHIAKFRQFLSEFRQDNSYLKHFAKLKELKLNKLK